MLRLVLIFGLIAGVMLAVMMLLTFFVFEAQVGFDNGEIIGYTTMVLAFLMVFFGVRSYRDNVAGGKVSFQRALGVGLLIALVASGCYTATWEVIYYKLKPDFGDTYAAYAVKKARESGASDAQIAETEKKMAEFKEMYRNPFYNIALTMLEPAPVGIIFAFVAAGVLSQKRRTPESV